jgi:hypothetical protein
LRGGEIARAKRGDYKMTRKQQEGVFCQICKQQKRRRESIPVELIREPIAETIRKSYPDLATNGFVCIADLNKFRAKHIRDILETGKGELSTLEEQVMKSLKEHELLSKNINIEFDRQLTVGERLSDRIAEFGGSWRFIFSFSFVFLFWIVINSLALIWKPFDPFPFILLNLILSCLAAIQAPVIMMSAIRT